MKAISTTLDTKYVADLVAKSFNFGTVEKCVFLSRGVNDTYLVIFEASQYVVRVYRHGWRSLDEILCEIDFVSHLASRSAPVAKFLPSRCGANAQSVECPEGERFMVLMECASDSVYESHVVSAGNPFSYGRGVGLLHKASEGFRCSRPRKGLDTEALVCEPLAAVLTHFPERESELSYLHDQACSLVNEINKLDDAGLRKMFLHGDLTGGNANLTAGGGTTFFDFDCCGFGWQAYDLAVFLWSLIQNRKLNLWKTFLEGYRSVVKLDYMDEQAIGLFVAARSFWIMGYSISRMPTLGSLSYKSRLFEGDVQFLKRLRSELPAGLSMSLGS